MPTKGNGMQITSPEHVATVFGALQVVSGVLDVVVELRGVLKRSL